MEPVATWQGSARCAASPSDVAILDHSNRREAERDGDEQDPAEHVEPLAGERGVRLLTGDRGEEECQPEPDHPVRD